MHHWLMDKPPRELVAASSKPLVLAVLAQGDSYGYAIIQEVKKAFGRAARMDRWDVVSRASPVGTGRTDPVVLEEIGDGPRPKVLPHRASGTKGHGEAHEGVACGGTGRWKASGKEVWHVRLRQSPRFLARDVCTERFDLISIA